MDSLSSMPGRGGVPVAPEQIEIKVPKDKVKVKKAINRIQAKSRARIQLLPLEEGDDGSEERTVRISGDRRQIDKATALIKKAISQVLELDVTDSNTKMDRVRVPKDFVDQNPEGLRKENRSVILMNEKGAACNARLLWTPNGCFILTGWTEFCTRNKMQIGDICRFKLLQSMEKPTFQLCTRIKKKKQLLDSRFVKLTPTLYSFEKCRQHLPKEFVKDNELKPGQIVLLDKDGVSYEMTLKVKKQECGSDCLCINNCRIWEKFCLPNEVEPEETFILELTERRELRFFSKDNNETERTEPNLDEQVLNSRSHQTSEFHSRSQGFAGPEEEAEFQRRSAELNEQFKRKLDEVEAVHTAKNAEHTFRLISNLQLELEMQQRRSEIRKNYEEEDSLLIAELQRRRAEVDEEFKRKLDGIEAEYAAKSSEHTSSFPSSAHCPMPQPR